MEGKVALEEHFSTELNSQYWNAFGEEGRNGSQYAQDIERRLLDPAACVREMDRAGIELCILSLTSPGVQSVPTRSRPSSLHVPLTTMPRRSSSSTRPLFRFRRSGPAGSSRYSRITRARSQRTGPEGHAHQRLQ